MATKATESLKFHPIASIFPLLEGDELFALADDIKQHGQREPVVLFEGKILDGRNRYAACRARSVEPKTKEFQGDHAAAIAFVWSENRHRRHLNSSQLAIAEERRLRLSEEYAATIAKLKSDAAVREKSGKGADGSGGRGKKKNPSQIVDKGNGRIDSHRAKAAGTNRQYLSDAGRILDQSPELAEEIEKGKKTIPQAKRVLVNEEKKRLRAEKAQKAAELSNDQPTWTLICSEALDGLQSVLDHHAPARLIFADPPYNIGVDYGEGEKADKLPDQQYMLWVGEWIALSREVLSEDGSFWILIGDEYAAEFCVALKSAGLHLRSWIKWYETFGTNCTNKFNRTSRHLFYCVRNPKRFVFNADAVTRPSDRQTKYNDKRASEDGKLWDDVWTIPRLTGTCEERIPDFPTQLPLALVEPVILCASDPGDLVVDPFNGSGTTGVACIRNQRKYIGIDKSETFIDAAEERIKAEFHDVRRT